MANYGTAIEIVTKIDDIKNYFIIFLREKEYNFPRVWYVYNYYKSKERGLFVNNVAFKVP